MEAREARKDYQEARLSVEQVFELIEQLQERLKRLEAENHRLRQRLAQYEPEILREPTAGSPASPGQYGLAAEERRREKRARKRLRNHRRRGRRRTQVKFAAAERTQDVYPPDVRRQECTLDHERAVWRLEDGRGVLVGYRVFRGPGGGAARICLVTPRCEYGLEILVVLAFLVYVIGISLDKAGAVMGFFCGLPLAKSQTDALLRQLARHWEPEFETLCDLIARAAVVYMDETGWKIGRAGCSLWTFASALQRVFLFGCRKDAATLDQMLPPDVFDGVGVSDDAAVYRGRFAQAQKCWAHLLRKAIQLALLYPRKKVYRQFLDRLLAIYYDGKRAAADGRLKDQGRAQRAAELEGRLCELCHPYWREPTRDTPPHERDFLNLVNELLQRCLDQELFTFVLRPDVDPTNNLAERLQRSPALDRKAGRTSKTAAGAHRRSVTVSVLESLRANLETFTLTSVLEEIRRWMDDGLSLFTRQWQVFADPPLAPNTS